MKSTSSFVLSTIIFIIAIVGLGFVGAFYLSYRIDRQQRTMLLVEAKQAALLVSTTDIASLSGTSDDLANPVYQRLKTAFTAFRAANHDIRFVYLMGYRPDIRTQFFYVDSEPETSADYSPPGQLFGDTREQDIKKYLAGDPYTDGPYQDSWGEWVSGYVPLRNEQGSVIAMIGVDISTAVWHSQIIFTRVAIGVIAGLLIILILLIGNTFYRRLQSFGSLAQRNRRLELLQGNLKHMQQLAQMGTFLMQFPAGDIVVDEQFLPLFRGTKLDKESFLTFVHLDDQQRFEDMLKEIKTSNIAYSWVDVRIGTPEAGFRKYHIYGNIERHASGPAEKFDGVIQDITDLQ